MTPHDQAADLAARLRFYKRGRDWVGDCPACGYARAGAVYVGKGARPILRCHVGCTREALDAVVRDLLGGAWVPRPAPDPAKEQRLLAWKRAEALRLFAVANPLRPSDPAGHYLTRRGLAHLVGCPALRHHGDCEHRWGGGRHPAMVARVVDARGRPISVHRTYLTPEGTKADADPVRASLAPFSGGAVRLTPDPAPPPELAVGEGIETAGSAGRLLGLPAWAAISAKNLGHGLVLPDAVRTVVIAADSDPVGMEAALTALARWRSEGRQVHLVKPDAPGQDFNDLLLARTGPTTPLRDSSRG